MSRPDLPTAAAVLLAFGLALTPGSASADSISDRQEHALELGESLLKSGTVGDAVPPIAAMYGAAMPSGLARSDYDRAVAMSDLAHLSIDVVKADDTSWAEAQKLGLTDDDIDSLEKALAKLDTMIKKAAPTK